VQKYKVISQDPLGGLRVTKGSIVNLVISEGVASPIIEITHPKDGDDFPLLKKSEISGTISYVPADQHLWMVMLGSNGIYYPFPDEPVIYEDTWRTTSYGIGDGEGDADGDPFIFIAYLLDEEAYKNVKEYVKKETFEGMGSSPIEGATEYNSVQVIGRL